MKRNLSRLSDEALRDLFEDLAIRQGEAWDPGDPETVPRYTKLYFEILDVVTELQSRPGDRRRILIPLLEHENWQVRLKTGTYVFALVPEQARRTLEWLASTRVGPVCMEAGSFLGAVDDGMYVPT
ncbi:MAG: hypothetical protein B7Z15_21580 [Rhizobiales bacterium 32-66-8]|nr:MAG: hypothetical protein B7Z30_15565 [Rhizobiales bacterium 12-68-15]OYW98944.1 MAG: hypothetical protein B7Z15_21580 [Rhizobiales bacterium 32-66-8]